MMAKRKQEERPNDATAVRSPRGAAPGFPQRGLAAVPSGNATSSEERAPTSSPEPAGIFPAGEGRALGALPAASRTDRIAAACDAVIDIAAALFNVSGRDLRSPRRSSVAVSRVRQIAMYVAHVTLRLSMRDVGEGFGRDRTTVLHACHQIEDLREDEEFDDIVSRVEQVVKAAFGIRAKRD